MVTEFSRIPSAADVACLCVDSRHLKLGLMPSPVQCLLALKQHLPVLMDQSSKALMEEINQVLLLPLHPCHRIKEEYHRPSWAEVRMTAVWYLPHQVSTVMAFRQWDQWPVVVSPLPHHQQCKIEEV
jgi:hypothetical protein